MTQVVVARVGELRIAANDLGFLAVDVRGLADRAFGNDVNASAAQDLSASRPYIGACEILEYVSADPS